MSTQPELAAVSAYGAPDGDAEWDALVALTAQVFQVPLEDARDWFEQPDRNDVRVLREEHRVVGGLCIIDMGQWFGGRRVGSGGVAAVAVPPEQRGRGVASRMMAHMLRELHGRGVALSALYASTWGLYRSVGYEPAGTRCRIVLDPRPFARSRADGDVRPITPEDEPVLHELATRFARHQDGSLDRHEYIWTRLRDASRGEVRGYLVECGGVPEAYVTYRQKEAPSDWIDLHVTDLAFVSPAAGRRLLSFLAQHGSMTRRVTFFGGPAHPLLFLLSEPHYEMSVPEQWMLRVVDVPRALEERGYGRGVSGELQLAVRDAVIPANEGAFVLRVEDGRARVTPGGDGQLSLDVRGLAPLYSGHRSAFSLRDSGLLEAPDEVCAAAGALFSGPAPSMQDMF